MSTADPAHGLTADVHLLGSKRWTELDAASTLLIVPIGSCEQHGLHLPLNTDTRIADAVAVGLAAALRRPAMIAPTIAISASGEHQGFTGTLSIGVAALETMLVELVRSADDWCGVVFVNGHGGNRVALDNAVARSAADGRPALSWWPRIPGGDAHAGRTETSLMMAIAPESVRLELAVAGATEPLSTLLPQLRAGGVAAVSRNGVLGDPAGASAAEGEVFLAALVADAVDRVASWRP